MLLRGMKLTVVGMGVLAGTVYAQGPKFGFEYRAGLTYNDGKIEEPKGGDAQSSTNIALEAANLTAEGEAAKNVNYAFAYNLVSSSLHIGNVTYKHSDMVGLYAGRGKVAQGGWHHKEHFDEYNSTESDAAFGYSLNSAMATYADSLGVVLNLAGTLSINAYNDVTRSGATNGVDARADVVTTTENEDGSTTTTTTAAAAAGQGKNKSDKSQAWSIEWAGNFGGWMPLVQLLSYDLNKSLMISAGIKGNVAGLGLMLNYTNDSRYVNKPTDDKAVINQIDAHVSYAVAGFTPWLGFHQTTVKQPKTDAKANSAIGVWDDNAQNIAVGVNCNAIGDGYVPYLALNMMSGKFYEAAKEESKSGMELKVGVMGKF